MCRNHFKKLGGKTLRQLDFAPVHTSTEKPAQPWLHRAAEVMWSAVRTVLSLEGREGGQDRCIKKEEPTDAGCLRFQPVAVRFCITRCQCALSQRPPSRLCRGCPRHHTQGPSAGAGKHRAIHRTEISPNRWSMYRFGLCRVILKHRNPEPQAALWNATTFSSQWSSHWEGSPQGFWGQVMASPSWQWGLLKAVRYLTFRNHGGLCHHVSEWGRKPGKTVYG